MSITICTVSGKGGTGKSTVSSGLAIAAAELGKKVLLVDLDCGLRCLDMMFGIDDIIVFDLNDALNDMNLCKTVYHAKKYSNISIIPAPAKSERIDFLKLRTLLNSAKFDYDYIILDFPAGLDFDDYSVFADALFLIVSGADSVSVKDAGIISEGIVSDKPPRLIINRFDLNMLKANLVNDIDTVIDNSATRLIGIVPADGELLLLNNIHCLKPNGRALKAFTRIIRRISGEDVLLPKLKKI